MPQLPFTFQSHVRPDEPPREDPAPEATAPAPPEQEAAEATGPTVFTVSQIQRRLRHQLERHYPDLWVAGEISNYSVNSRSGHAYFTLKDQGAALSVVMFDDHRARLRFTPRDGTEALARGTLTVWPKGGRLQLAATHLEPRGVGALQQAFEELVAKLRAEGLTALDRKRARPTYPRTVGVVTSRGSAAMRDVLRTLLRRDPQAHVRFGFAPVQGKSAAFHIVRALERLDASGCDVLLLARGGGSAEDLWAFNEEAVARAVAARRAPVITGIGHETDTTIADLVADLRASTPTAAAELALPVRREVLEAFDLRQVRLQRAGRARLDAHRRRLDAAAHRLPPSSALTAEARQTLDSLERRAERAAGQVPKRIGAALGPLEARLSAAGPRTRLGETRRRLEGLGLRLERAGAPRRLSAARARLSEAQARLEQAFGARALQARRTHLQTLERRLEAAARQRVRAAEARLGQVTARAEALSPLAVLARGFSLTTDPEGRVVRDAQTLHAGDEIRVRLAEGRLRATVLDVDPDDRG